MRFKPYEFWHPRVFEFPYYVYLLWRCLIRGLPPKFLAKANYALDHGEIGIGSKYTTQLAFDQQYFLPTIRLDQQSPVSRQIAQASEFAEKVGFPLVLKPDLGSVGKGVVKLTSRADLERRVPRLRGSYLLQKFTPWNIEVGVFYVRQNGTPRVTGINRKHFPTVVGNGRENIEALARSHYRYTDHWRLFLRDLDTSRVPDEGEVVQLSFIGSHTMGCKFTDETSVLTPALEQAVFAVCAGQPGFNFGRLDLKAESEEALLAGNFVVIEINGVPSLPTNMFDPSLSLFEAYGIFLAHGRLLVDIANEHRDQPMDLKPWREIGKLVKASQATLNETHRSLIES